MDDQDYLSYLEADLSSGGSVASVDRKGESVVLTVTRYEGVELEFPTVIRTTREAFSAYLTFTSESGLAVWPEGPGQASAYALFRIHLDEEMTVLAGNPDIITVTKREMKVVRDRPYTPFAPPPGDYEWRA